MHICIRLGLGLAVAGYAASMVFNDPATAQQQQQDVMLRVPLQLKKMIATGARLTCGLHANDAGAGTPVVQVSKDVDIAGGEFDQIVEISVPVSPGIVPVKSYRCEFKVRGDPGHFVTPIKGQPLSTQLYRLARPDAFFRQEVSGPVSVSGQ